MGYAKRGRVNAMRTGTCLSVLFAMGIMPLGLLGGTPPVGSEPGEFVRLRGIYTNSLVAIEVKYADKVRDQSVQYQRELDGLSETYRRNGNLKGVLAVQEERKQFGGVPGVPGADNGGEPPELKALKVKFRGMPAKLDVQKRQELDDLTSAYIRRLSSLERKLTMDGKIEAAVSVHDEFSRVNGTASGDAGQGGADSAGEQAGRPQAGRAEVRAGGEAETEEAPAGAVRKDGPAAGTLAGTQKSQAVKLMSGCTYLVEGEYFVPQGMTLEIGPGTVLRFQRGALLSVGGALYAKGSPASRVRLLGMEDGIGFWKGVTITGKEQSAIGCAEVSGAETGIYVNDGKAAITDSLVSGNSIGVRVKGRDSSTAIENCIIENNRSHGVDVYYAKVVLTSCTVSGNGGFGVWGNYYPQPTLERTRVTGNAEGGIYGRQYSGVVIAHESVVTGNGGADVVHLCDGDWDFARCWWGAENTALLRKSDTANLDCVQDSLDGKGNGRVRVGGFLEAEPSDCGSSLNKGVLGRNASASAGAGSVARALAGGAGPEVKRTLSPLTAKGRVYLCDLPVVSSKVGCYQLNRGMLDKWEVNGETVKHGLFACAPSEVIYDIGSLGMTTLEGEVGLGRVNVNSSVQFKIYGDSQLLWKSGVTKQGPKAGESMTERFSVKVRNVRNLRLEVDDLKDRNSDHSIWIDPKLIPGASLK